MEATAQPSPPADSRGGFFESLIDTRFDHLITPKMVRFLYILAMIVLAVGVVVAIVVSFANDAGSGVLALVVAPLVGLVYLIVTRLYLELIVILFKIRDAVEEVADNTRG